MDEKRKVPKLRFPEFTDPWEQRKLGEIITEKLSNGIMNHPCEDETDVKHINVINMYTSDKIHVDDLTASSYGEEDIKKCNVEIGDIFLTRSSVKPEGIAEANVLLDSGCFVYDDHLIRMKIDKNQYDPLFVKISLGTPLTKQQFIIKSKTTAFTTIGQEDISSSTGLFPSIIEQKKIGDFFKKIENLITLHQRKLDEIKEYKKGMLQKMFPQKGEVVPEIRFPDFTDPWEQRKLGDVASSFEYGLNAAAKEFDGVNKYLRITDIDDTSRIFKDDDLTSPDVDLSSADNYQLHEGDILFARTGASVGKSYIYRKSDGLVYFAGFLIRAKIRSEFEPEFIFQNTLGTSYEKYVQVTSQRSGQPGVNAQEYSEYSLLVPSSAEQKIIAGFLRQLDNLITLHQRKLDAIKEYKKGLLQQMFV